jgi:hypothetical protein
MQREDAPFASISSLPLELLAAIFGQLASTTTAAQPAASGSSTADQLELLLVAEDDGDAMMEEETEDSARTEDEGEGEEEERMVGGRARSSTTTSLTRRRASAMEAVRAVLTASAVCSSWREILVKENALWKRVRAHHHQFAASNAPRSAIFASFLFLSYCAATSTRLMILSSRATCKLFDHQSMAHQTRF